MRLTSLTIGFVSLSLLSLGCSTPDETEPEGPSGPTPLPAIESAPLSTDRTIKVLHGIVSPSLNPQVPEEIDKMLAEGFGDVEFGPGQAISTWTLDGAMPPAAGGNAKMLTRFVHLADTQLADDESPARLAVFDGPGLLSGAFRPQEGHECRILNAAVRTINAFHKSTPVDFVLLGGDNTDNAQSNELDWFGAILDGADSVECDSGDDDDPVKGPDNDPKDPFVAEGLSVPWRWVTGNHDILSQGTLPVANRAEEAVGGVSQGGTRDWAQPGAPVVKGDVIADPKRALMTRAEQLEAVSKMGDGHGIGDAVKAYGKAYYWFDVEGTPLRIMVLDTAAETGSADGVIHKADVDGFIKPALDQAKSEGKWVILTSHHASSSLTDGSGFGGTQQPDALAISEWQAFVGGYDNVLMHLAGHTHVHRVTKVEPMSGFPYWELETSALADYPHQMRVIEVWDEDNGYVMVRAIGLDYVDEGDAVSQEGRKRAIVDLTSGFGSDGSGDPTWRNVELWFKKPN